MTATMENTERVAPFEGMRVIRMRDAVEPMMARIELAADFPDANIEPTGIQELDEVVRLQPGKLAVLAGREGAGKSALALQIARWWSGRGAVLYVLTEMTIEECVERIVANTAHIPLWQIQKSPTPAQRAAIRDTLQWLSEKADITIIEAQGVPIDKLILEIRRFASYEPDGVRGVIIDNLWGVTNASKVGGDAFQVSLGMGQVTQKLVRLSMNGSTGGVDAPVLLLHHLNRVGAAGKQPATVNLGGSDQIGFFADAVMIIAKEQQLSMTDEPFSPEQATHRLHVTKNRGGRTDLAIPLTFVGDEMRFAGAGPAAPFAMPEAVNVEVEQNYRKRLADLPVI